MPPRPAPGRVRPALAFLLALLATPLAAAHAGHERLPEPRCCMGVFLDGDHAFLVGGRTDRFERLDDVLRLDLRTGRADVVARLPFGANGVAVAWTGSVAYFFGGMTDDGPSDAIFRFSPATEELVRLQTRLPVRLGDPLAFWDARSGPDCPEGCVHVLGTAMDRAAGTGGVVLRFSVADASIAIVEAGVPSIMLNAGVFDGQRIVLVGSGRAVGAYDPVAQTYAETQASLPQPTHGGAAVIGGGMAYVVGGIEGKASAAHPVRYDLQTREAASVGHVALPPLHDPGALWWEGELVVLGGVLSNGSVSDDVLRLHVATPRAAAPAQPTAEPAAPYAPLVAPTPPPAMPHESDVPAVSAPPPEAPRTPFARAVDAIREVPAPGGLLAFAAVALALVLRRR